MDWAAAGDFVERVAAIPWVKPLVTGNFALLVIAAVVWKQGWPWRPKEKP